MPTASRASPTQPTTHLAQSRAPVSITHATRPRACPTATPFLTRNDPVEQGARVRARCARVPSTSTTTRLHGRRTMGPTVARLRQDQLQALVQAPSTVEGARGRRRQTRRLPLSALPSMPPQLAAPEDLGRLRQPSPILPTSLRAGQASRPAPRAAPRTRLSSLPLPPLRP